MLKRGKWIVPLWDDSLGCPAVGKQVGRNMLKSIRSHQVFHYVIYPGSSKYVLLLLGRAWHVFWRLLATWQSFYKNCLAEISIIYYDWTETVSMDKFVSIGMIMYRSNFLEDDLRTHELQHVAFLATLLNQHNSVFLFAQYSIGSFIPFKWSQHRCSLR